MTIEQYAQQVAQFVNHIRIYYKSEIIEPMGDLLNAEVENNMRTGGQYLAQTSPGSYFQTRKMPFGKIGDRSGKLSKSLIPGQTGNIFKQTITDKKIAVNYGTKLQYAYYNEFGANIPANEGSKKFFWFAYFKTGIEYYKNLALAMINGTTLRIKPRPFFEPGINEFYNKDLMILLDSFIKLVKRKLF